jgi:hypothetical protein
MVLGLDREDDRDLPGGLRGEGMRLAEGRAARAPGAEAAALMQRIVCDVVTGYPKAGVAP